MSKEKRGVIGVVLAVVLVIVYIGYALSMLVGCSPQVCSDKPDGPAGVIDCVVEVSAYHGDKRSYGYGVVVTHGGDTFVLTSTMLFTEECDFVTITKDGIEIEVEAPYKNTAAGLVALTGDISYPSIRLNDYPNIPPGVAVKVVGWLSNVYTAEHLNEYWILLDAKLPVDSAGMPVMQNHQLVGVIVGICITDDTQAIMCGNYGLKEFCDQVNVLERNSR